MGCDIHMYAEKKVNGTWKKIGKVFNNPYYRPGKPNKIDEDGYEWNPQFTDQPYRERNYNLFGILADVRNGHGFAGIKTGGGFNPISEPRDLPDDVSEQVMALSNDWGGNGHSHSWFTLKELMDYDWNQLTYQQGYVDENEYRNFKRDGKPSMWCSELMGSFIKKIENSQMDQLIAGIIKRSPGSKYCTMVQWGTTYRDAVGQGFFNTMEALSLQSVGKPENVRIVFWFDN